ERLSGVRQVGWNGQHLARADIDLLRALFAEPEAERAFEDVGDLLVLVLVAGNDGALLQIDVRDHHPIAADHPAADALVELLRRTPSRKARRRRPVPVLRLDLQAD